MSVERRVEDRGEDEQRRCPHLIRADADAARDDFLAIAAHELKTPLSVVIGWAQYAQRQVARGATDEAVEKLEVLVGHAWRLARLVEDFSDVVRIQNKSLSLGLERRDLRPLVEQAVRNSSRAYPNHGFRVELAAEPVMVQVDSIRLGQALANLLDNAAKFSPRGGPVTVRLAVEDSEARVVVSDQGIGIPAEEMPHVFERYYQADRDILTRRFSGVGVGLFLTRALVDAHGGRIWAKSPGPDQGSTFTFALPLA